MTATDAKKLCPEIQLAHVRHFFYPLLCSDGRWLTHGEQVATWKAGESHWSYSDSPNIGNSKACLDPYRCESKKILSVFQAMCPNTRTEKASIDEFFLDLSKDVHDQLLLQYQALQIAGNPNENLPLPDVEVLNWNASHLVANERADDEMAEISAEDVDWDDVAMAIGAGIVKRLRDEVFKQLGYTCSAGIASNKMIAKLGAGFKKPDQQVVAL
jgi:DNA polymerase eta